MRGDRAVVAGSWGRGQMWGAVQDSVRQVSEPERAGRDIGRDGMLGRQKKGAEEGGVTGR